MICVSNVHSDRSEQVGEHTFLLARSLGLGVTNGYQSRHKLVICHCLYSGTIGSMDVVYKKTNYRSKEFSK